MSRVQPYAPLDWELPLAWYCPADGRLIETSLNDEYGGEGWYAVWVPAEADSRKVFADSGVAVYLDGRVGYDKTKTPFEFSVGCGRWLLVNEPHAIEQSEEEQREQLRQVEGNPLFAMWA